MERRIYEAALEGNVVSLCKLLQEDALALDRFMVECYAETPLHVAAMLGHLQFVQEILHRKPELAGELDSQRSSPLHLAAAKGYLEVVKNLIRANRNMCSHPDRCGRNPLHIAAIKGHVDILRELVQARSEAAHAEMERGEMILHACVRFNKMEVMKFLVESINSHEFLNSKDCQGNTILHLAVIDKQTETIKFLTTSTTIEVNALNAKGFTALDISIQTKREVVDWEIEEFLRSVGAISTGKDIQSLNSSHHHIGIQVQTQTPTPLNVANYQNTTASRKDLHKTSRTHWMETQRGALMVVASLIATMAFQVGVNPPGGVWQETADALHTRTGAPPPSSERLPGISIGNSYILGGGPQQTYTYNDHDIPPPEGVPQKASANTKSHLAGHSVMADNYPYAYRNLVIYNTIGFIASLSIIVLLISGLSFKSKFVMWILMVIMWAALTAMALTYALSISFVTPQSLKIYDNTPTSETFSNTTRYSNSNIFEIDFRDMVLGYVIILWIGLLTILLLVHTIRLIVKIIICFFKMIIYFFKCCRKVRAPSVLMV